MVTPLDSPMKMIYVWYNIIIEKMRKYAKPALQKDQDQDFSINKVVLNFLEDYC